MPASHSRDRALPIVNASRGLPVTVTVTAAVNVTATRIVSPRMYVLWRGGLLPIVTPLTVGAVCAKAEGSAHGRASKARTPRRRREFIGPSPGLGRVEAPVARRPPHG